MLDSPIFADLIMHFCQLLPITFYRFSRRNWSYIINVALRIHLFLGAVVEEIPIVE